LQTRSIQTVLDDYQARNPGRVAVEIGESGGAVPIAKIKAAVAASTAPDLWGPQQLQAGELAALGALVDLEAELRRNKDWPKTKREYTAEVLGGATWKGKLTLMPLTNPLQLFGFNKRFLTQAGVPFPKPGYTWDDFLEIGRRAAQPPDRPLFALAYTWTEFVEFAYGDGLRLVSADRTKAQFASPPAIETLQWLHDQVAKGIARNGAPDFDQGKSVTETINANTVTGPRFPNVDPGDGSGIHTIHYPFGPSNTKKELLAYSNVYGPAVFKSGNTAKVAAAAEIAAWAGRSDVQMKVVPVSGTPPANSVAAREENLPANVKTNPILKAIFDAAKSVVLTPNFPSWNDATTVLNDSFQRVAKGDLRPRDALTEAQTRIQALFDEDLRRG
jgi:multiple sugar transport system substrate-binding protein